MKRKALRLLATFIVLLVLGLSATITWVSWQQGTSLVHPARTMPSQTPADWPVLTNWEDVRFTSADGLELVAWFIPPDPAGDGATIIFVHGLGSNRGGFLSQAAFLAQQGYGALLLDLRNHGQSEGDLTTFGFSEVEDVRGAVDYALSRPEVNPERIALIGGSLGGATVLRSAARIPEVAAVIAQSAYATMEDNVAEGVRGLTGLPPFPFAPLIIYFAEQEADTDIKEVRPVDDLAQIAPRPIMFVHGELDELVIVENSQRMYEAATGPKELYLIDEAYHTPLYEIEPEEFERRVIAFLATHLRGE